MILRDKYGYPVEKIEGKTFTNFIRLLIHTNIKQTIKRWKMAKLEKEIATLPDGMSKADAEFELEMIKMSQK